MTTRITTDNFNINDVVGMNPIISSIDYPQDDTAANTGGGESITVIGYNFNSPTLYIDGSEITITSSNTTHIQFTSPAGTTGRKDIFVVNSDGSQCFHPPGFNYAGTPTWITPAGPIGSFFEYSTVDYVLSCNSTSNITFTLVSGSLPSGLELQSNGHIMGTLGAVTGQTTYNFSVKAQNEENQDNTRAFSVIASEDTITWTTPSASLYNMYNVALSGVTFDAVSASGQPLTFTANTLPQGTSIVGNQLTGTPTLQQKVNSIITATLPGSGKSATAFREFIIDYIGETTMISGAGNWIVPAGVTQVHVLCVGGGGGGLRSTSGGGGGRGGSLRYKNNIAVTPGATLAWSVGLYGSCATTTQQAYQDGASTWFINTSTVSAQGGGGGGRSGAATRANTGVNTGDGGGDSNAPTQPNSTTLSGGGSGAGGYSGNGGNGGFGTNVPGGGGAGGAGGGGGGSGSTGKGGSGGGTGCFGAGANGAGGAGAATSAQAASGRGGSQVSVPTHPHAASGWLVGGDGQSLGGGHPGGAGGGCDTTSTSFGGNGAYGAIRVIWGYNRAWPSTNTAFMGVYI